jgi:hypothetical protein
MCPRDEGIADRTWFPDEDICRLADVPDWVKRQRKVSRRAAPGGYFTLTMLRRDCRIARGIKGIDPDGTDKERTAGEDAWLKAHPVITVEQREKMKAEGEKKTALLHRARLEKTRLNIGPDVISGKKGIQIPLSPREGLETR